MDNARIAPELLPAMRRVPPIPFGSRLALRLLNWLAARRPTQDHPGVLIETVRSPALRIYRPVAVRGDAALLWMHGGGFVIGNALQDDRLCAHVACTLGILVASVEYRLAPAHSFPAPLDDCHAAWGWLRAQAAMLGIDPVRIAIGGMSAGGGLAATLVQRIHDDAGADGAAAAQWLLSPMLDDRTAADRTLDAIDHPIWNNRRNRIGWQAYLGCAPGAARLPAYAAAARRDDLADLPPAFIGIAELDLFRAEEMAYAARLRAAGVPVHVESVAGAPHGFEAWGAGTALARDYESKAIGWLGEMLDMR